jgi:hypothetical protein
MKTRVKLTKKAVTHRLVYAFAHGCLELNEPEAAVAMIRFERLQRPENLIAGYVKWTGYRSGPKPTIRVKHHKTGAIIDRPLEGDVVKFYAAAEEVLVKFPRRGIPMVLRELKDGNARRFAFSTMQRIVQRVRKATGEVDYVEALAH